MCEIFHPLTPFPKHPFPPPSAQRHPPAGNRHASRKGVGCSVSADVLSSFTPWPLLYEGFQGLVCCMDLWDLLNGLNVLIRHKESIQKAWPDWEMRERNRVIWWVALWTEYFFQASHFLMALSYNKSRSAVWLWLKIVVVKRVAAIGSLSLQTPFVFSGLLTKGNISRILLVLFFPYDGLCCSIKSFT